MLISVTCSAITVACASHAFAVAGSAGRVVLLAQDVLPRRFRALAIGALARVFVYPPAITPQPLGDMLGRIVERCVGISCLALAAQPQPAAGMHIDVTDEEAARPAEGDLRLQRMVEVLARNNIEVIGYTRAQRVG